MVLDEALRLDSKLEEEIISQYMIYVKQDFIYIFHNHKILSKCNKFFKLDGQPKN